MFPSEGTFIAATKLLGLLEKKKIGESLYFLGCLVLSYVYSLFLEESLNMPGTSVFPLSETGVLGDFWGRIKGEQVSQWQGSDQDHRSLGAKCSFSSPQCPISIIRSPTGLLSNKVAG